MRKVLILSTFIITAVISWSCSESQKQPVPETKAVTEQTPETTVQETPPDTAQNVTVPEQAPDTTSVPETVTGDRETLQERFRQELISSKFARNALNVGNKIPSFQLMDHTGMMRNSGEFLKNGPLVIIFFRGGWCDDCNKQLKQMEKIYPKIKAMGADLIALSPEVMNYPSITVNKNKLTFTVLSDINNEVAKQFGIVYKLPEYLQKYYLKDPDLTEYYGSNDFEMPLTAAYVVDKKGYIRWAFIDEDYTKKANPEDILNALKKLEKKNS